MRNLTEAVEQTIFAKGVKAVVDEMLESAPLGQTETFTTAYIKVTLTKTEDGIDCKVEKNNG